MTIDISAYTLFMALGLTALTALATCIGSLLAFLPGAASRRFVSGALGLSAGVMVYVALTGILPESIEKLGHHSAIWAVVAFIGGIGLMALLDFVLPGHDCGADSGVAAAAVCDRKHRKRLRRTGLLLATTISVHNFPKAWQRLSARWAEWKWRCRSRQPYAYTMGRWASQWQHRFTTEPVRDGKLFCTPSSPA